VAYGTVSATVRAGTRTSTLKPTAKARRALRAVSRATVALRLTFTPAGGTAATRSVTVRVTGGKKG